MVIEQIITAAGQNEPSKWEIINRTKIIYLAYDCELNPCLVTDNLRRIKQYCRDNNCQYSEYKPGTYSER